MEKNISDLRSSLDSVQNLRSSEAKRNEDSLKQINTKLENTQKQLVEKEWNKKLDTSKSEIQRIQEDAEKRVKTAQNEAGKKHNKLQ